MIDFLAGFTVASILWFSISLVGFRETVKSALPSFRVGTQIRFHDASGLYPAAVMRLVEFSQNRYGTTATLVDEAQFLKDHTFRRRDRWSQHLR